MSSPVRENSETLPLPRMSWTRMPSHFHSAEKSAGFSTARSFSSSMGLRQHHRVEARGVVDVGSLGPVVEPVEQLGVGHGDAVPDFLEVLHVLAAHIGEGGLGETGAEADAEGTGRELHQRPALVDRGAGEKRGDEGGELRLAGGVEQLDQLGERGQIFLCAVVRPDQRDGFAEIADIVVAHAEQDRVDFAGDDVAEDRGLHVLEGQRAGEDGEGVAAIGVGRGGEILRQRLDLAVARWREGEEFEELGELLHSLSSGPSS